MAVRLDFFFISTRADTQKKKKTGGTLALTLKKNNIYIYICIYIYVRLCIYIYIYIYIPEYTRVTLRYTRMILSPLCPPSSHRAASLLGT